MFLSEELQQKWQPVLEHADMEAIKDPYKKAVTAVILENQQREMASAARQLNETSDTGPTNTTGAGINNFDPILISLVRRALPNLIAYDVAGVQPMTGPTGLIFAMRAKYGSQGTAGSTDANEAFYNEANTDFSGAVSGTSNTNIFGFANTSGGDTITNPIASLTANALDRKSVV